jgi:hypothetical protein
MVGWGVLGCGFLHCTVLLLAASLGPGNALQHSRFLCTLTTQAAAYHAGISTVADCCVHCKAACQLSDQVI